MKVHITGNVHYACIILVQVPLLTQSVISGG